MFVQVVAIIMLFHFELLSSRSLIGVLLFASILIITSEFLLRFLVRSKQTPSRFSKFMNYIRTGQGDHGFPHKQIYPDFHYYTYHPFYHFAPKPSGELKLKGGEINSLGLRGREHDLKSPLLFNIYLSGDCLLFDAHHKFPDTLASKLEGYLRGRHDGGINVLNASCPHYSLLHCLNRLTVDMNRFPINLIVLSVGINDVLAFIHPKNGSVPPDYTNLYKPFDDSQIVNELHLQGGLNRFVVVQALRYLLRRDTLSFTDAIEKLNDDYNTDRSARRAERLFTSKYFENYLKGYISTCKTFNLPLMLVTINFNLSDMKAPHLEFVARKIRHLNSIMRDAGSIYGVPVLDMERLFVANPGRIYNKWHHTKEGNDVRAEIMGNFISENFLFSIQKQMQKEAV